jgi:hypothetical protein
MVHIVPYVLPNSSGRDHNVNRIRGRAYRGVAVRFVWYILYHMYCQIHSAYLLFQARTAKSVLPYSASCHSANLPFCLEHCPSLRRPRKEAGKLPGPGSQLTPNCPSNREKNYFLAAIALFAGQQPLCNLVPACCRGKLFSLAIWKVSNAFPCRVLCIPLSYHILPGL